MDFYKKKLLRNVGLAGLFIAGIVLQFQGHSQDGYGGLVIQLISLGILILVLFLYNRRYH